MKNYLESRRAHVVAWSAAVVCVVLWEVELVSAQESGARGRAEAITAGWDWSDRVAADHPAFADAATSMPRGHVTLEKGFEGSGTPGVGGVGLSGGFLARAGMPGDFELRLKLPSASYFFGGRDDEGGFALPSVELGVRKSFALHERLILGVTPHAILPSGLESSPVGGVSGQLGVVGNVLWPEHGVTLWVATTPRYLAIKASLPGEARDTTPSFELDMALGASRDLSKRWGVFLEGWGVARLSGERSVMPAADGGVTCYVTPDLLLDAYIGTVVQPEGARLYGGVGMTYRRRLRGSAR